MSKILFGILLSLFLSACVTEEGTQKHKEKNSMKMSHQAGADGLMWHGTIYAERARKLEDTGIFNSRDECMHMTVPRMHELAGSQSYSCSVK